MIQTQIHGYENIGSFETKIKDYSSPNYTKKVTLDVFVENRTKEVFIGSKKPQMKLENFIKAVGKEPEPIRYDLTQKL